MAVTPLVDGEDRSIDARSIVTLIVFIVVSECVGDLAGVYSLTSLHIWTLWEVLGQNLTEKGLTR